MPQVLGLTACSILACLLASRGSVVGLVLLGFRACFVFAFVVGLLLLALFLGYFLPESLHVILEVVLLQFLGFFQR